MKLPRAILLPLCLLAALRLDGATVWDDHDARVDTLNWFESISVTLHRPTAAVLEYTGPNPSPDDALRVRATDRTALAAQPLLPGWDLSGLQSGLVADGVTPLLIRIASTGPVSAGGDRYDLELKIERGGFTGSPQALLKVAGATAFVPQTQVTLTQAQPEAFVTIDPIQPGQLQPSFGEVRARLEVRRGLLNLGGGSATFNLSRPPVALVHGYNVKNKNWGAAFTNTIEADRARDLVIPVGYGIADDSNTTASLWPLAATLDEALRTQVEEALHERWAFTRYDAVGHSQGGVLLRMLCSQNAMNGGGTVENAGFPPWRNAANHHRGRFRRVVTIGSPHAGSTLGEMGTRLRNNGVPFPIRFDAPGLPLLETYRTLDELADRLLQPKFQIGSGTALQIINSTLICDPAVKMHLVRTAIYGGHAPGDIYAPEYGTPQYLYYSGLFLDVPTPAVPNPTTGVSKSPGIIVVPNGSDGVVDANSQIGQLVASGGTNHHSTVAGDIAHAVLKYEFFGDADTVSGPVADRVIELLDGTASAFGSFTIPPNLVAWMQDRKMWIAAAAHAIAQAHVFVPYPAYTSAAPAPGFAPPPPGDVTLHFTLQPPAGESPNGPVEWSAVVYGPDGVTPPALTLAPTGTQGEQLALTIPAALEGQVVLSVRFPSTSGQTVIGTAQKVAEQLGGRVLAGIETEPLWVQGQVGAEIPLRIRGIYDDGLVMPIFTTPADTTFASSDPSVATVDASGRLTLVAVGTAEILVTHAGSLEYWIYGSVLDALPTVVSPALISATVGQALTWQLAASQAVWSFSTAELPPGLTLDAASGLIEGTPTAEGRYPVSLTVENANGRGSKLIEFVIAGVPGGPTDLGLDATSVSNGRPAGTIVARLATIDPNPLDTFTYALVSGTGSANNALFAVSGDVLVTAAVLSLTPGAPLSIRVRTTDSAGAFHEKALALTVGAPPTITQHPAAQRVFVDETVTFRVEVSSAGPVSYSWRRDGVPIPDTDLRILELYVWQSDAGSYSVEVSNADGSAISAAAELIVDPVSYGRWTSLTFGSESGPLVQPDGDYNGDGIPNFLDFAFGVNPTYQRGATAQPMVTREQNDNLFTYRAARFIAPLQYRILTSENLSTWNEYVPASADITWSFPEYGYALWTVRVPAPSPRLFLKLEVRDP